MIQRFAGDGRFAIIEPMSSGNAGAAECGHFADLRGHLWIVADNTATEDIQ